MSGRRSSALRRWLTRQAWAAFSPMDLTALSTVRLSSHHSWNVRGLQRFLDHALIDLFVVDPILPRFPVADPECSLCFVSLSQTPCGTRPQSSLPSRLQRHAPECLRAGLE